MTDVSLLFEPLEIRGRRLRNRIVMPPMVVNRGIDTPAGIAWYGAHARGGVALVIVEATGVDGFAARHTADTLMPLVDAIHEGGALAAIQLFPGARGQKAAPAELDRARIEALVEAYSAAAVICASAGFDGIEIHGAHGFLLNQFFSPTQNTRHDAYGGTLGGRMLLAVQIARAVRSALPDDRLLLYRHTPDGPGYTLQESLELAAALVGAGVDVLDLSPSSIEAPGDRAAPFRALGVPVITVNDLDRVERAVEALREERADLIAVGRGLIADAEWPNRIREGEMAEQCAKCDHCYVDLDHGGPVGCLQWPREQR
jgi:2,4-dienoyl-CoA reductase-like NADH-dependent reductase (Old Yellow Enzyme family)